MKCDYCDKEAVLCLCRLEKNPKTSSLEHDVSKAFCWEDALRKGVFVSEEPKGEKPVTLTSEEVAKGTRAVQPPKQ